MKSFAYFCWHKNRPSFVRSTSRPRKCLSSPSGSGLLNFVLFDGFLLRSLLEPLNIHFVLETLLSCHTTLLVLALTHKELFLTYRRSQGELYSQTLVAAPCIFLDAILHARRRSSHLSAKASKTC
ncbi:hypothetical protein CQW23_19890 [Capsicum baccatum]|uniref:Uncharacterized protein n=3 Tax=Capsicum TaxID=4071 RepID=A0A075VWN9_CAPAN|nr:hypothetical protein [Capsicum annuum]AIG89824.1 hypothetical protein [Capsicum annuum]AIG90155.1 hypothetical protein [Capsicum annuum]PHT41036.1 hypothetical protein CQW23_19890 [Capsicum baccatum]QFV19644.1 hypothetical protein [Capsicum annuum var. glabriusculum]